MAHADSQCETEFNCEPRPNENGSQSHRRLQGQALQDQNSAYKDQLILQEKEIQNCKDEVGMWKKKYQELDEEKSRQLKQLIDSLTVVKGDCDKFSKKDMELVNSIEMLKESNARLRKEKEKVDGLLFEATEDLKKALTDASNCNVLRDSNERLQKEVMLLGELLQRNKGKLDTCTSNLAANEQQALYMEEALRNEVNSSREKLNLLTLQLEWVRAKADELETKLQCKDIAINDMELKMDRMRVNHQSRLDVEHQRLNGLKNIVWRSEQHIINQQVDLEAKSEELKKCQQTLALMDIERERLANSDSENGARNGSSFNSRINGDLITERQSDQNSPS